MKRIKYLLIKFFYGLYFWYYFRGVNHHPNSSKEILFFIGSSWTYLAPLEILLYHLYKFRGYKCRYLIYNDSIPIAESARARRFELIKQKLSDTFDFGSFILTAAKVNFEIIPYTAVLEISEEQTLESLQ